jgi:prepilin-type processing-associated H-X9-DG protein
LKNRNWNVLRESQTGYRRAISPAGEDGTPGPANYFNPATTTMTRPRQIGASAGFTVWELIAVGAGLLMILFVSTRVIREFQTHNRKIICASNIKSIGLAFQMYANEHSGAFPRFVGTNEAWDYFQLAGTRLKVSPVVTCPADEERLKDDVSEPTFQRFSKAKTSTDQQGLQRLSSYFYSLDASAFNPQSVLSGDRNLAIDGQPVTGLTTLNSNTAVSWSTAIHNKKGNISLADGSVRQTTTATLRKAIAAVTNQTQCLIIP